MKKGGARGAAGNGTDWGWLRYLRRDAWRGQQRQTRRPHGKGAFAGQDVRDRRDREESRVFPAAVRGIEHPAVRPMHGKGAEEHGKERDRYPTTVEAGDDRHATDQ